MWVRVKGTVTRGTGRALKPRNTKKNGSEGERTVSGPGQAPPHFRFSCFLGHSTLNKVAATFIIATDSGFCFIYHLCPLLSSPQKGSRSPRLHHSHHLRKSQQARLTWAPPPPSKVRHTYWPPALASLIMYFSHQPKASLTGEVNPQSQFLEP